MYSQIVPLILFGIATAFTPGPNNIMASYSGFNFGFKKTIPLMLGVIFGWTALLISMEVGLIFVFQKFTILQDIIKVIGSVFLIYLAYKIAFSKPDSKALIEQPITFAHMFVLQFVNPKGVMVATIIVSTSIDIEFNYLRDALLVTFIFFWLAVFSISTWCLMGKYLRHFATSKKFLQGFNYTMAILLIVCVVLFYI